MLAHVFHDRIDMAGIALMCGACITNVTNQQGQMLDLLHGLEEVNDIGMNVQHTVGERVRAADGRDLFFSKRRERSCLYKECVR